MLESMPSSLTSEQVPGTKLSSRSSGQREHARSAPLCHIQNAVFVQAVAQLREASTFHPQTRKDTVVRWRDFAMAGRFDNHGLPCVQLLQRLHPKRTVMQGSGMRQAQTCEGFCQTMQR